MRRALASALALLGASQIACVRTTVVPGDAGPSLPPDRSPYYEFTLRDETGADWEAWQRPDTVLDMLGLEPGMRVIEFGAGVGRLSPRIARAVGETGSLVAVENDVRFREPLARALAGFANARAEFVDAEVRGLAAREADVTLVRNFYHRAGRPDLLFRVARESLKPGGRLFVIDFRDARTGPGPPLGERIPESQALVAWSREGFRPLRVHPGLRCQYALEFAWDGFTRVGPLPPPPRSR